MTILFIDDDPDDFAFFSEGVTAAFAVSINCVYASNGKEAIQLLEKLEEPPSYIFLDYHMPIMNGKECLEIIARNPKWKDIPVYLISTTINAERLGLLTNGAKGYLKKPKSFEELVSLLKSVAADSQGLKRA